MRVSLYVIGAICLWIAELAWTLASLRAIAGFLLSFRERSGYKRGRQEGFELGYEAGRERADDWWLEAEREVEREREKIRGEGHGL